MSTLAGKLETAKAAYDFIVGGNALVTFVSLASGKRFTYKVQVPQAERATMTDATPRFVKVLVGPDNGSQYEYLGMIRSGETFYTTKATRHPDAPSVNAFRYTLEMLAANRDDAVDPIPEIEVWHHGKCGRCGRTLTVPTSIASGFGPECAGLLAGAGGRAA